MEDVKEFASGPRRKPYEVPSCFEGSVIFISLPSLSIPTTICWPNLFKAVVA